MTDEQKKSGAAEGAAKGKAKDVPITVKTNADEQKAKADEAVTGVAGLSEGNPYAELADNAFSERPSAHGDLLQRIMADPRMHDHLEGFQACIQCGTCTSACPAARFTDYVPREIARRALDGDETLLTDDTVWYCFYCYTCQSRCPRGNSVAVLNQIIRSMQCDTGYGVKHVQMFAPWGEQYYDKGMGGTPQVFFANIAEMCGPKWKAFVARRNEMRAEMGLGTEYPSDKARDELQGIMDATGFRKRLVQIGGWGGKDPKGEYEFDEHGVEIEK